MIIFSNRNTTQKKLIASCLCKTVCMQLNEKNASEPTFLVREIGCIHHSVWTKYFSFYNPVAQRRGKTIREEIMRRLRCCKIHPALPLEMIGPNRNVYTTYKMLLKCIRSFLEWGLRSVNDFIITIQSLLVIDRPELGKTSETHARAHTDTRTRPAVGCINLIWFGHLKMSLI